MLFSLSVGLAKSLPCEGFLDDIEFSVTEHRITFVLCMSQNFERQRVRRSESLQTDIFNIYINAGGVRCKPKVFQKKKLPLKKVRFIG